MKRFFLFALLLLPIISFAQAEKEIQTAVESLKTAMLAEDVESLRKLTSSELSYGHSNGVIENQEEFLAVFAEGKTDYQSWDISEFQVSFHGKTTALVRHKVAASIVSNGTPNKLNIGLLMVWVKEKGDWKLLARQAFRLTQP